jgi:hypothetical protein
VNRTVVAQRVSRGDVLVEFVAVARSIHCVMLAVVYDQPTKAPVTV